MIHIWQKYVLQGLTDIESALVQVMTSCWTGIVWTNDDPVHCHMYVWQSLEVKSID